MDISTVITLAVIIAVCVLLTVTILIKKKKEEQRKIRELTNLASRNNCEITVHEFCGHISIGLDEKNKFLFFIKKNNNQEISHNINLADVTSCRLINTSRSVNNGNGVYKVTDRLELGFSLSENNKTDIRLEFYNADSDGLTLTGELQLIEKWEGIIKEMLKTIQK